MFGSGSLEADLVLVGEAPGAREDQSGIPFWGPSGQLLRSYLKKAGLPPERVFITNTVRCRPPQNRDPLPVEIDACREHLDKTLELISPRAILLAGAVASRCLTGQVLAMSHFRSLTKELDYEGTPLFFTYHPAYILRNRKMSGHLLSDLREVKRYLDEQEAETPKTEEGVAPSSDA